MIDQEKIILMTKLAVYEKSYIKEDRRRGSYYLEDYLYVNNFKTRLSVTTAVIVFAVLDIMNQFNDHIVFPNSLGSFLKVYVSPYLIPWMLMLLAYTLLSSMIYKKRYALSQKRLKGYNKLLKQLDTYEQDKAGEERSVHETQ